MIKALEKIRTKAVVCTDWRPIDIFSPSIADAILGLLNATKHKILRGGILLNAEKATFNLQVERVLRDAGNSSRRCFRDPETLVEWLSESLEPAEIDMARSFLEHG